MALGTHSVPHTQAGASTPTRGTTHAPKTPNPSPPKPKKPPLTPGRVQRLLANAGTRSKLPDAYLPPALLAQRQQNRFGAQPITPGSTMTERDLARQTRVASDVRYGAVQQQAEQNVAAAGQVQRDTSDYYDQYLRELAAHQANVGKYQAQAQQAVQGISQATGALPAQGAATDLSAENQQVAQNASSVRRALTDSFGALLASQGANANTYADTLARVVGPGAKVQALGQAQGNVGKARQQLEQLVKERGSFRQQTADETRQSEAKNVLATAIATGKQLASTPEAKAAVTSATEEARQAAKYGYSLHDWRTLGPKGRADARAAEKPKSDTVYSSGPFAGHKKSEIDALTDADRQKLVDDYKRGAGKKAKTNVYGAVPGTPAERRRLVRVVESAQPYVDAMKAQGVSRSQALKALQMGVPKSKDNPTAVPKTERLAALVALDKAYNPGGKMSRATLAQLQHRGYRGRDFGIPIDTGQPQIPLPFGVSVPVPEVK